MEEKEAIRRNSPYYIGLDVGTNSVGWAVSDPEYNVLRFKGNSMWGARLFEEAKPAADRRAARIARASSELRAMGIGASLQVQATIGHGAAPEIAGSLETARGSRKTCPAKAWTG